MGDLPGRASGNRPAAAGAHELRVTEVHRQARPTLWTAFAFAVTAPLAAIVPHRTGAWLPLHLFLVGGLLTAISGATQLLSVTWSSAPAPRSRTVRCQVALVASGTLLLAAGREAEVSVLVAAGGAAVVAGEILLAALLAQVRSRARLDRFNPAIDGYLAALALGVAASIAGIALGTSTDAASGTAVREAHLITNLFGLVGITIAATLPYMAATQGRSKMSPAATPAAVRTTTAALAVATLLAAAGRIENQSVIGAAGMALYACGLVATASIMPRLRSRQLRWAGPRLASIGSGIAWWLGATIAFGASAASDRPPPTSLVLVLVVGGYAQILAGSLAYLAPVLRGGGHHRLASAFRITRSYISVVAANVAVAAIAAGLVWLGTLAIAAWVLDATVRAALLVALAEDPAAGGA